jgi:hypothetical protein
MKVVVTGGQGDPSFSANQKSRNSSGVKGNMEEGSDRNEGIHTSSAHMGQTIMTAYGKDASSVVGSGEDERNGRLTGGVGNLSHSFKGDQVAKAPDRGNKPKL